MLRMKQTKDRCISRGFGTWRSLGTLLRQVVRWRQQPAEGGGSENIGEDVEPECTPSALKRFAEERGSKVGSELEGCGLKGGLFLRGEILEPSVGGRK